VNISRNGIELIKHFEGCELTAYKCPADVWTVGYGHTGSDVLPRMVITKEKANQLLARDVERFEHGVNLRAKVDLNQGQFDALVSFAYNLGLGALERSTLLKLVNAGRFDAAAGEFGKWVKAGGKVLDGLVRRRKAEAHLFRTAEFKVGA
jgi:lysozyme